MTNKDPLDGLDKTFEFRPPFLCVFNIIPSSLPSPKFLLLAYIRDLWRIFDKAFSLGSLCLDPNWSYTLAVNPSDYVIVLWAELIISSVPERLQGLWVVPPIKKTINNHPFLISGFPKRRFHYGLFVP